MIIFYRLSILLYGFAIKVAAIFNKKAALWISGRKLFFENLPPITAERVQWFHCASLGEFEQARPLIESWNEKYPEDFILVTFFSPSGYEIQKDYTVADYVCYLPLDTRKNANRFVKHFNPTNVFFIKYEFWLNFIDAANRNNTKLFSVSTLLRPNQRFFKWYGGVFRKRLSYFSHFFVQNEATADLLSSIRINNKTVTGDTRFDRVYNRTVNHSENNLIANWLTKEKAFVIGSSWPVDESFLIPFINSYNGKVIIAPHEVNEKHIQQIEAQLSSVYEKYTSVSKLIKPETKVLILDCIGVLADAYKYGEIAYVGGAFGSGLHNILEPAAFRLPVIFGPKHKKFPEAQLFIDKKVGFSISDADQFEATYKKVQKNIYPIQQQLEKLIQANLGATDKIIDFLDSNN